VCVSRRGTARLSALLDNDIVGVAGVYDDLDFRDLVPRHHEKKVRIRPHCFVLRERELNEHVAPEHPALAAKSDGIGNIARRAAGLDPLVDLPKQRLVVRDAILKPARHETIIPG
jgi:hypothetical protein